MWGNMARLAAEYIFLDTLFDFDPDNRDAGRIEVVGDELFVQIAAEKQAAYPVHRRISAISSCCRSPAPTYGMKVTALFRPPNNPYIADYILSTRQSTMGELLASRRRRRLRAGRHPRKRRQYRRAGRPEIHATASRRTFFGRTCETNPLVPKLARQLRLRRLSGALHRGCRATATASRSRTSSTCRATPTATSTSRRPRSCSTTSSNAGCARIRASGCGSTSAGC